MSASLSPLSLAAQAQAGTPYYGLLWLALATIAYTDENSADIANVGVDLPAAITSLPDPPAPPKNAQPAPGQWGTWQMDWGPVVDASNSNLMYACSYREVASGLPIFAAVCIRGTDTQEHWNKTDGLLKQLYQDLDVGNKVLWANAKAGNCTSGAAATDDAIAKGTCAGLQLLRGYQASAAMPNEVMNVDILTYVTYMAKTYANLPIVVTGHSLGGAQTTVMARFLAESLKDQGIAANIVPHPFAPPTAGTASFVQAWSGMFRGAQVWWNTFDIVPNAFQNIKDAPATVPSLTNIQNLWTAYGGPGLGPIDSTFLAGIILVLHAYSQPTQGLQTLNGAFWTPTVSGSKNDWVTQLMIQHFPPAYHYYMSTQLAATVAAYPYPGKPNPAFVVPPPLQS